MKDKSKLSQLNPWRLVLRQQLFDLEKEAKGNSVLFVNPPEPLELDPPHQVWSFYAHPSRTQLVSSDTMNNPIPQAKDHVCLSPFLKLNKPVTEVCVFIPKEKSLTQFIFQQLANQLPLDTLVYLVGANNEGIRSYQKRHFEGFSPFVKLASGNHCQIFRTQLLESQPFDPNQAYKKQSLKAANCTIETTFLPGVFHENKLDPGTALLLQHAPKDIQGHLLDFGCGSGIISAWMWQNRSIQQITASDLSALAIAATQKTLAQCPLPVQTLLLDGLAYVQETYDWIVTNPPFHQGKSNNYDITSEFIQDAPKRLKPRGKLLLVANIFLPWQAQLEAVFNSVEVLARNKQYQVFLASGRKK